MWSGDITDGHDKTKGLQVGVDGKYKQFIKDVKRLHTQLDKNSIMNLKDIRQKTFSNRSPYPNVTHS